MAEMRDHKINPSKYIDCKLSVSENKFKDAPDYIKAMLETARSVKAGSVNIKVEEDG